MGIVGWRTPPSSKCGPGRIRSTATKGVLGVGGSRLTEGRRCCFAGSLGALEAVFACRCAGESD